jgi:predicted ATPase/class 3 adenylate cyclase
VTFLFTDLEGSTGPQQVHPAAYRDALRRHHALLLDAVAAHGGVVFETVGDAVYAAFARPTDAVGAALAGQLALHTEPWGATGPLRARMGVHLGEVEAYPAPGAAQGARYLGLPLVRCARLMATAHGGQTVLSEAVAVLGRDALPEGAMLRDLGEHRLKDLQRPERVFQLLHPALPAEFPPLRSLDARPHNLPLQLTSFVGRERELAEVARLLVAQRLVTLTGTGGCGKTRLALQAAAAALEADGAPYPDGVWLAELGTLADEALLPQAVLSALGLRELSARPAPDALADYLRPRALLLILDNCEHLVGACALLVDALLRTCPGLRVLATSRELLGVAGEVAWRVPSLSLPPAGGGPGPQNAAAAREGLGEAEAVGRSEAARLFVERGRLVQPAFAVGPGNASLVAQLCRRLDGIPLALELAAARLRGLTLEQLVARLDDRFRLLVGGSRTALRRQQTLRAAVDWSYGLLADDERTLLRRLSVFAGGWTVEAAEAAGADLPDVLGLLLQLVDKSLVLVDSGDAGAGGGAAEGAARYRLLETIRQYAGERLLEAGEAAAARDRHRDHFLAWAERAAPHVVAGDQVVWLPRIEADHDNLRAALDWCQGDGSDREPRLAAALAHFWLLRGYGEEGRVRLRDALERGDPRPSRPRAVALDWLGYFEVQHAGHARGLPLFEQAAAVAREVGDGPVRARALRHLAMFHISGSGGRGRRGGRPALPERGLLEEALAAARAAGDRRETGYVLSVLGARVFAQGDRPAGLRMLAEALPLLRQVGDRDALSNSLRLAGTVALARGDRAAARALFEEALTAGREMGWGLHVLVALTWLGRTSQAEGDLAGARSRFREALRVAGDRGDRTPLASVLRALGGWCVAAGRPARAARLFGAEAATRAGAPILSNLTPQADHYAEDVAAAHAALGAATFQAAWAEGQAMPLEQAVAYALEEAPAPAPDPP